MLKKLLQYTLPAGLIVLLPWSTYAQAPAFQPGYVLRAGADTLRGQVRLTPERAQRECEFRTDPTATATTYSPAQVRAYGQASGQHFRRGRILRSTSDTTTVLRFLRVLVAGRADLLFAQDENGNIRYYLQMAGAATPTELRQLQRRIEQPGGRLYTQTINQYQQILLSSLADCPALAGDIGRVRLNEAPLISLVQRYNACVAPAGTAAKVAPVAKTALTISVLAGGAFGQTMDLRSSDIFRQYNQALTAPAVPVVGLQLTLRNLRLSQRVGLMLGAYFQRRNFRGTFPGAVLNTFTVEDHSELAYGADFLRLPIGLIYEFGRGHLRPFAEAGYAAEYRLHERENSFTTFYKPYNGDTPAPSRQQLFEGAERYAFGYHIGAGLMWHPPTGHDLGLRVQYASNHGPSPYNSVGSRITMIVALLSYNLTKN